MLKRILLAVTLLAAIASGLSAQQRLKMTSRQVQYYNDYTARWSGWPGWELITTYEQVILEVSKLDYAGNLFLLTFSINGERYTFSVYYVGYNNQQGWYVYRDSDGNEITVEGTYLGYLADYGWPSNKLIQIYFWIYSENMAIALR